jgi:hypothetical protein
VVLCDGRDLVLGRLGESGRRPLFVEYANSTTAHV